MTINPTTRFRLSHFGHSGIADNVLLQRWVDHLADRAFPGGTIYIDEGQQLSFAASVSVRDAPIKIQGSGPTSVITGTTAIAAGAFINDPTLDLPYFEVADLTFRGGSVNPGTHPTLARTDTDSIERAFRFFGSKPTAPSLVDVGDVVSRNCRYENLISLPVYLDGMIGQAQFTGNTFENTRDPGFIDVASVIFNDNTSRDGWDNGVSVSRGCEHITITGNLMENMSGLGIWVSGYVGEVGPETLTVTGNTIRNCGFGGIRASSGCKTGVISNNTIDGMSRGALDDARDTAGYGIRVSPTDPGAVDPVAIVGAAQHLIISGNLIKDCDRGAILLDSSVSDLTITGNQIVNPGSATNRAGDTILSTDVDDNFGIRIGGAAVRLTIKHNDFVDTRGGAAVANYAISGFTNATSCVVSDNEQSGFRQAIVEGVRP